MAIPKFVNFLNDAGILFYTKKTNYNNSITDVSKYKQIACCQKNANNVFITGSNTLVIFTGNTSIPNKYLIMIDFDKLDKLHNNEMYQKFTTLLNNKGIETILLKNSRND